MLEKDAYAFLVNDLGATGEEAEVMIADAVRFGFTDYMEIGGREVCLARVPAKHGARSTKFQVTVK